MHRAILQLNQGEFGERIGFSRNTVLAVEKTNKASERFVAQLDILERDPEFQRLAEQRAPSFAKSTDLGNLRIQEEYPPKYDTGRPEIDAVPREMGRHSRAEVYAECEDPAAFAMTFEGDSMEPRYVSGDILVLMPSLKPRNDDLVVAKFKDGNVLFRLYHQGEQNEVVLTSYNPIYPTMKFTGSQIEWIYPVDSMSRKINRRKP